MVYQNPEKKSPKTNEKDDNGRNLGSMGTTTTKESRTAPNARIPDQKQTYEIKFRIKKYRFIK